MTAETIKRFNPLEPTLACDPFTHLTRVFVYFLQAFFEHSALQGTGMQWTDNEETTELIITGEKPRPESIEKIPHIAVVLNQSSFSGLGMDQMQSLQISTGKRTHTDMIPSTVSYHCMAKEGLHARRIAWYAAWATVAFRRLLMKGGQIFHIQPTPTISGESPPAAFTGQLASDELISVVVTIPFFVQYSWSVQKKNVPLLKNIGVDLKIKDIEATLKAKLDVRPIVTIRGHQYYSVPIDRPSTEASVVLTQSIVVSDD